MIPLEHVIFVSMALFTIGAITALVRRSLIAIVLAFQLMLGGASLAALAFNRLHANGHDGQVLVVVVAVAAAAQLVVSLAVIAAFVRERRSQNVEDAGELRW